MLSQQSLNTFTEPPVEMARERNQTSFNPRLLTFFLDGGEKNTQLLDRLMQEYERDPVFRNDGDYDITDVKQSRELAFKRIAKLIEYVHTDDEETYLYRCMLLGQIDMGAFARYAIHHAVWGGAIKGAGTPEQYEFWVKKGSLSVKKFYGSFSMTELGHGSNLVGLETTATFDRDADEFVINTPNVAATKWWIGGAADTATHTAVFARLIVDGEDHGVKTFVVQLRDVETHNLMPGIAVGDCGKKMGRQGTDNGWIQFTHVRIPRPNMLMRYCHVDSDGNVTEPMMAQMAYGALLAGRVGMAMDSYFTSRKFLTISLRYATIRRAFAAGGGQETKLIDYPYHQRRLLPLMAQTYAIKCTADKVREQFVKVTDMLLNLDVSDQEAVPKAIAEAKELFSVSAGVKAITTWACAHTIDQCRQACGGHGYSAYNGFGRAYSDWVIQCTWEGDNNILCLSAGRALVQSNRAVRAGKPVGGPTAYLAAPAGPPKLAGRNLYDPKVMIGAWETVSRALINRTTDEYEALAKTGLSTAQAYEELSQQRFLCTRIHTRLHMVKNFYERIAEEGTEFTKGPLTLLANLYAFWSVEEEAGIFLREAYITPQELKYISAEIRKQLLEVRKDVIGYTDAFNVPDFFLNSAIGRADGDVYKNYFNKVNTQNPPQNPRPPYYESVIRPFLFRKDEDEDICTLEDE